MIRTCNEGEQLVLCENRLDKTVIEGKQVRGRRATLMDNLGSQMEELVGAAEDARR